MCIQQTLEETDTGHLVGSSTTLADIGLFETLLAILDYFGESQLMGYPEVIVRHLL